MAVPSPTPIYRITHIRNLDTLLRRNGLHAPNFTPDDGLPYTTIHDVEIQLKRNTRKIPCSPFGVIHDYVPFYFGTLSPMMLKLKTGQVDGYADGQEPLIYLVSTVQAIQENKIPFVFSDGHGIAAYTHWYNDLNDLENVDWNMVHERYWRDTDFDLDRKRRKQAEFLVHQFCDWSWIVEVGVINEKIKSQVETILHSFPGKHRPVKIKKDWYY